MDKVVCAECGKVHPNGVYLKGTVGLGAAATPSATSSPPAGRPMSRAPTGKIPSQQPGVDLPGVQWNSLLTDGRWFATAESSRDGSVHWAGLYQAISSYGTGTRLQRLIYIYSMATVEQPSDESDQEQLIRNKFATPQALVSAWLKANNAAEKQPIDADAYAELLRFSDFVRWVILQVGQATPFIPNP